MIRCCFRSFAMVLLLCVSGDSGLGQHQVELPQEVIAGWRRLAEQSKTYRILFSDQRLLNKGRESVPIIMTRLNDKYVKYENLKQGTPTDWKEGEIRDFSPDIESVFLYDGSEYFSLLKSTSNSKYTLAGAGSTGFLEETLRPNVSIGPKVRGYDLLDLIDSQTNKIQAFEKGETSCRLTYNDHRRNVQSSVVHLELDPSHDYRVISAVFELPTFRTRAQYFYEDHPAFPAQVKSSAEKPDAPISQINVLKLLPDQKITRDQFQLEYYGVPPFRKRSWSYWPMIAVTAGGIGVLVCAIFWWRRNREEN